MRKTLSIMLVSLLAIFAFMSTDVKANDMVDYLVEKKIVEGDGSGDFKRLRFFYFHHVDPGLLAVHQRHGS